ADLGIKEIEELPPSGWGHHHMGTCRMGSNPRTSVVDANLRVHGTANLFVAGGFVFFNRGPANSKLDPTALSLHAVDYLRLQLQEGSFPFHGEAPRKEGHQLQEH